MSSDLSLSAHPSLNVEKREKQSHVGVFLCVFFVFSAGQFPRDRPAWPPTRNWRHSADPGEMWRYGSRCSSGQRCTLEDYGGGSSCFYSSCEGNTSTFKEQGSPPLVPAVPHCAKCTLPVFFLPVGKLRNNKESSWGVHVCFLKGCAKIHTFQTSLFCSVTEDSCSQRPTPAAPFQMSYKVSALAELVSRRIKKWSLFLMI